MDPTESHCSPKALCHEAIWAMSSKVWQAEARCVSSISSLEGASWYQTNSDEIICSHLDIAVQYSLSMAIDLRLWRVLQKKEEKNLRAREKEMNRIGAGLENRGSKFLKIAVLAFDVKHIILEIKWDTEKTDGVRRDTKVRQCTRSRYKEINDPAVELA